MKHIYQFMKRNQLNLAAIIFSLCLSMGAWSQTGQQVFIPIGVGDITTFVPLLPAPEEAIATEEAQPVGDSIYHLSWQGTIEAAYYQINITDDQGKVTSRQTSDLNYTLSGLPLGESRVTLVACNLDDQCGAASLLGRFTSSERVRYAVADSLGSPILQVDQAGNVLSEAHYKPYGETEEEKKEDIGYTGHMEDTDLGLTYMQARYYDPVVGRFLSNDPVGALGHLAEGNIQGFNRYAYANNSPYNFIDPDGRKGIKEWLFGEAKQKAKDEIKSKGKDIIVDEMRRSGMSEDQICRAIECNPTTMKPGQTPSTCAREKCEGQHGGGELYPAGEKHNEQEQKKKEDRELEESMKRVRDIAEEKRQEREKEQEQEQDK